MVVFNSPGFIFFLASLAAYGCKLLRKCLVQLPVFQYDFNTVFYICLSAYIVILFHNLCCRSHRQTFQEYYLMPHILYISLCMYCNGDGCCCNQFCAGGFNINCSCFVLQPRQRNYLVITAAKKGVTADAQPSQYTKKIRYIARLLSFRFQIMWTERILIIMLRKKVMHHCTVLMHVIVESMVATFANIVKKITTSYMYNTYLVYEMFVKADC